MNRVFARSVCTAILSVVCTIGTSRADESVDRQQVVQEAQTLLGRVNQLFDDARYREAIPLGERALALYENIFGPEDLHTADALNVLGRVYRDSSDFNHAQPLIERSLKIREKILGPDHPDVASSLNNLGGLYYMMGRHTQAERIYKRALTIREQKLGPTNLETAISLNNLALLCSETGAYATAESLFLRALAIRKNLGEYESVTNAWTIANLAQLYWRMGAFTKAQPLLDHALSIRLRKLRPDHPDIAFSLQNLGTLYYFTGAYAESESMLQRALAINEQSLGPEHTYTAATLQNLGLLYARIGAFDRAKPLLRRAVDVFEKTFGRDSLNTALVLGDLASLYSKVGEYDTAEKLYKRDLAIREGEVGDSSWRTANSLQQLGELYLRTGRFNEADSVLSRALAIREKTLGPKHPDTAVTIESLALLRWSQNRNEDALRLLQRVHAIEGSNSATFLLIGSEARKREYLRKFSDDAYANISFSLSVANSQAAHLGFESVLQIKGRALDAMADDVSQLRASARTQDRALFEELEKVSSELSALTYQETRNITDTSYRKLVQDLNAKRESLESELAQRSSTFRRQMTPITVEDVRRAIPARTALIEWFRYVPFDPKQFGAKELSSNARYVAYVLKKDSDPVAIDVGDAQAIDLSIRDFRSALSDSKHTDVKIHAAELYARLVQPLATHINHVEHLLISPDGMLNLLPMSTLLDQDGEYLAQRFDITYLTSGRDLLRMDSKSHSSSEPLVVANPTFGEPTYLLAQNTEQHSAQRSVDLDRSGLIFRSLANTEIEAEGLKNILHLDASNVLLGEDATETRLKQLHSPRVLHIATHGFFLSDRDLNEELKKRTAQSDLIPLTENPLLRSGIALSGANARHSGDKDDGILTALEAAQLDLHGTELVVLSACDSGVGDIQNGDGVYGLRRALVLAGAQTQVTSLWKVSDEATRILMVDFYERLLKGEGRSEALRHAQLDLMAKPEFSHPYYWASFIPIGNWKPLSKLH